MRRTSNSAVEQIQMGECRCGCQQQAIPGTEVEAAQMVLMRTLADRLRVIAALQDERGEQARHLLWVYERAMWGLDSYVHQDWSKVPLRLGPPTTSAIEFWRRRVLHLIEAVEGPSRRWRFRRKRSAG